VAKHDAASLKVMPVCSAQRNSPPSRFLLSVLKGRMPARNMRKVWHGDSKLSLFSFDHRSWNCAELEHSATTFSPSSNTSSLAVPLPEGRTVSEQKKIGGRRSLPRILPDGPDLGPRRLAFTYPCSSHSSSEASQSRGAPWKRAMYSFFVLRATIKSHLLLGVLEPSSRATRLPFVEIVQYAN